MLSDNLNSYYMKKLIVVAVSAIVAVSAGIFAYQNSESNYDDMFSANVEALADQESGGFGPMCSQTGTPGNFMMKRCSNCNGPLRSYAMDYVAFCNN